MPRGPSLDIEGALHHIMVKGNGEKEDSPVQTKTGKTFFYASAQ